MTTLHATIHSLRVDAGSARRAFGYAFLASWFVSLAQLQFKWAASGINPDYPWTALALPGLWLGGVTYLGSLYWTLKGYQWGELSLVLPVVSLSNVWNVFFGYFLLGEPLSAARLAGTGLILLGIILLTR